MTERKSLLSDLAMVEIEVHSFCNRKCWFCPNSFIDRTGDAKLLPPEVYTAILQDLAEAGWAGKLSFGRYNEPFGHPCFYDRLSEARRVLPKAKLHTNSNGDYLTPDTLDRARAAGLQSLHLQLYHAKGKPVTWGSARAILESKARWPKLNWVEQQGHLGPCFDTEYGDMHIHAMARDFSQNGTNRCGLDVSGKWERTRPCEEPRVHLYVDFTGDMMPCCNLRHDYHPDYILGRISQRGDMARIFASKKAVAFREAVQGTPLPEPCIGCRFGQA